MSTETDSPESPTTLMDRTIEEAKRQRSKLGNKILIIKSEIENLDRIDKSSQELKKEFLKNKNSKIKLSPDSVPKKKSKKKHGSATGSFIGFRDNLKEALKELKRCGRKTVGRDDIAKELLRFYDIDPRDEEEMKRLKNRVSVDIGALMRKGVVPKSRKPGRYSTTVKG